MVVNSNGAAAAGQNNYNWPPCPSTSAHTSGRGEKEYLRAHCPRRVVRQTDVPPGAAAAATAEKFSRSISVSTAEYSSNGFARTYFYEFSKHIMFAYTSGVTKRDQRVHPDPFA